MNPEPIPTNIIPLEVSKRFVPPTIEEATFHGLKLGLPESECHAFWFYYDSKSWLVGRSPMKVWKSALAGWAIRWRQTNAPKTTIAQPLSGADKMILERERGRIEDRLRWIVNYYNGTPWSPAHRSEHTTLKTRLAQLRGILNVTI